MKDLFLLIICIALFSYSLKAQLKVIQNGTVLMRGEKTSDDPNDEVSAFIYGKNGTNLANGRLSIGDYGRMSYGGANVFLGEYGTGDTDIMQLHGKRGFYLTRDFGEIVAYYKYTEENAFQFSCDVKAHGVKLVSDERLKNNINELEVMLPKLKLLNGVSYNLTPNYDNINDFGADGMNLTEKEKAYFKEYKKAKEKEAKVLSKKRMGFLAQDVQKIFPELVEQDSLGYLSLDYIGLIPVLVEAIKEQQEDIDNLQLRLEVIENDCCNNDGLKSAKVVDDNITEVAKLYGNTPNPFNIQTTIRFKIPNYIRNAQLHICNMTGTLLKTMTINQRGDGSITINANEFVAGMYLYSLITDGKIIDTKQMLLTN